MPTKERAAAERARKATAEPAPKKTAVAPRIDITPSSKPTKALNGPMIKGNNEPAPMPRPVRIKAETPPPAPAAPSKPAPTHKCVAGFPCACPLNDGHGCPATDPNDHKTVLHTGDDHFTL